MKKQDKKLWKYFCGISRKDQGRRACPDELTLSSYIDGKLSAADRDCVEMHLAECPCCLETVSQIRHPEEITGKVKYTKLNQRILYKLFKPPIPFNAYRHIKVAALAASFIILFSVVMVMVSRNKTKPLSKDAKIARIIELYNNNKFYRLSKDSLDGFEPSDTFCSSTRIMHHAADTDKNGRISMNEVLQYISATNPQPKNQVAGN